MTPKHFTIAGEKEYGYLPRERDYAIYKARYKGHRRPLVFDGVLEQQSKTANIRATSKGVTVTLPQARKANYRNPHSQINMAQELTTVSKREEKELANFHRRTLTKKINAHSRQTSRG